MKRINFQNGFSLVEAMIAGVIFSIAVAGTFATVSSMKQPSAESNEKIQAAYFGKQVLAQLRARLDQRNFLDPNGDFVNGTHPPLPTTIPLTSGIYNAVYTVSPAGSGKKVVLTVDW